MELLPYEMIAHILYFVQDRIYTNMTCSTFNKTLLKMVDTEQITDCNDPYVLSQKHKIISDDFNDSFKQSLPHITNHKSLDYICYVLLRQESFYSWDDIIFVLLKQFCITNYASHKQCILNIFNRSKRLLYKPVWSYMTLLISAFTHKSWNVIPVLMSIYDIKFQWRQSIIIRYKYEENIDVIIDEINFLVDKNIIDYDYAFDKILYLYDSQFPLRGKVLDYLSSKKETQFTIEI
jgi:hypothetical protein